MDYREATVLRATFLATIHSAPRLCGVDFKRRMLLRGFRLFFREGIFRRLIYKDQYSIFKLLVSGYWLFLDYLSHADVDICRCTQSRAPRYMQL